VTLTFWRWSFFHRISLDSMGERKFLFLTGTELRHCPGPVIFSVLASGRTCCILNWPLWVRRAENWMSLDKGMHKTEMTYYTSASASWNCLHTSEVETYQVLTLYLFHG
jgi:hypothetical protein